MEVLRRRLEPLAWSVDARRPPAKPQVEPRGTVVIFLPSRVGGEPWSHPGRRTARPGPGWFADLGSRK
ncbi:hypothetical protein GCM10022221_45620 [Actinocorallia aurea]